MTKAYGRPRGFGMWENKRTNRQNKKRARREAKREIDNSSESAKKL